MNALLFVAVFAAQSPKPATPEEAKAFVKKVDADLRKLWVRQSTAEWIKSTYITDDTERNAAALNEDVMAYVTQATKDAQRFKGLKLDAETERMLLLLRLSTALPAPSDAAKRAKLAELAAPPGGSSPGRRGVHPRGAAGQDAAGVAGQTGVADGALRSWWSPSNPRGRWDRSDRCHQ